MPLFQVKFKQTEIIHQTSELHIQRKRAARKEINGCTPLRCAEPFNTPSSKS